MNRNPTKRLGFFERYLSLWVLACMVAGLALGRLAPDWVATISSWEFGRDSHVNVPIAVLIWLMIYPMMLKIDFGGLHGVFRKPRGLFITLFVNWLVKPFSMALLATLTLIFAFQAGNIITNWNAVILLAVPILIQVYFNSGLAYGLMRLLKVRHSVATPGALIGASNFFELAVAVAITLFGPTSPAALATVVGVLVEVPVMLSVCRLCTRSRSWYQKAVPTAEDASSQQTPTTP